MYVCRLKKMSGSRHRAVSLRSRFNGNFFKIFENCKFCIFYISKIAFFAKFESFPITSKKENLRFSEVNGFIWWTVRDSNPRPAD